MTSVAKGSPTKRVSHIPPMSMMVPMNGRARITAFFHSPKEENRKISPSRPAMSVWPNRWVWLVWIRSGVRIQTLAVLLSCAISISFSALNWPCPMWVIGISGGEAGRDVPVREANGRGGLREGGQASEPDPEEKQGTEYLGAQRQV